MANLSNEQYIQALEKMKNSPRDRVGILGELSATAIGAGAGVAAAGTIATAAGASTLLGSSTLGSLLGGVLITTTPVGWIIGAGIGLGALGFAAAKLAKSGGASDAIKSMSMSELKKKIEENKIQSRAASSDEDKYKKLVESLQLLIKNNRISQQQSRELLNNIQNGRISADSAFSMIQRMLV
jgi:alanine dehydrogenase